MSTAGTKGVPRAERENQILEIAAERIAAVGYAGLNPGEVAERAGVSKPLVYTYFGTKDQLYAACVERAAAAIGDAVDAVIAGPAELEMAANTLAAIFGVLEQRPYYWSVVFDRSHPAEGPAADAARAARRRIAAQASYGASAVMRARGVDDPQDLAVFTDIWMGAVTALVSWWIRHPEQSAEAMIARSRRFITALS
ncbi:TetR/AcrR family transcriptional regulator [Nocardia niigatensis]|uniref:TetR/AcrR family transcriptional regulator n=1 Tax=Nocardia niigatensis TaxID=209249 RepID=UPI00059438B9|nr:TetR/AcrR family transcriptional regulator [Nocardia niigatensis]